MFEIQSILNIFQKGELIEKLEGAGYAFASWRMPNSNTSQLIISLQNVKRPVDFQIAELASGFIVNSFKDNHPAKPYFIAADIIINENEVSIAPHVKSSEIDQFKKDIESASIPSNFKKKPLNESTTTDFEASVSSAVQQIKHGHFEKVVLSRYKDLELPTHFSPWDFFQRISDNYQNAFINMFHIPEKGFWIGATPELLLSNNQNQFKTVALAGTKTIEDGKSLGEIAWTQKEIEEQAFVSRYIINCFKKIRLREFHEHGPKTIEAGTLAHLKTEFIVDYKEVAFENLADQMLELLHPTSAVCGMPIENTKPWIEETENYDREFYAGFIGPVNFEDSTNLFVNLRCMKVDHGKIRFYAGAGITEDSIPFKEYEETEMKMGVLKSNL